MNAKQGILTTVALLALVAGPLAAQGRGTPEDEKAIRDALAGYSAAFSRGDAAAFAALWTPEAEYITAGGDRVRGREAIGKRVKEYLAANPGDRLRLTAGSLRFITADVAQVDGTAEVRGPSGPPDINPYAATLVKRDGKWLIDNVRDLSPPEGEAPAPASERLKALDWLVGKWRESSAEITVEIGCRPDASKNFLLLDYAIRVQGKDAMNVSQRIGWDPQTGQFHSWIFDSEGGFAEGRWDRDGDGWAIRQTGVLPDGGTGSATFRLTPIDKNSFRWQATDRRINGERTPDVDITFKRGE